MSFWLRAWVSGSADFPRGCSGVVNGRDGSKFFTSPAICAVQPEASKRVILDSPLRPAISEAHVSGAVLPQGVTAPMPVMTTRRGWEGEAVFMKWRKVFLVDWSRRGEPQHPSTATHRCSSP